MDIPDVDERVALLGAHLIGVTFSRYVLRDGPLHAMSSDQLVDSLASNLRAILVD